MEPINTITHSEGDKFYEYSLWGIEFDTSKTSNVFFAEYKMAVMTQHYYLGHKMSKDREEVAVTTSQYLGDIQLIAATSAFGMTRNVPPPKEAVNRLERSVVDRTNRATDAKAEKDKLLEKANILTYIAHGNWQAHTPLKDDKYMLLWFGKEENLPLVWFVVSINETYMRLHAWSRSLLTPYLYKLYYENEDAPGMAGVTALSFMLFTFRKQGRNTLYGEFLKPSMSIFGKISEKLVQSVQKTNDREANLEPQKVKITGKLINAFKDPSKAKFDEEAISLGSCILCQAPNAGYYMAHLGKDIRFCGRETCLN